MLNPFLLNSASFLVFFCIVGIAANWGLRVWMRKAETAGAPPQPTLTDPYLIAYLRGGEQEARRMLLSFPLHKVGGVHLSGGKWVPEPGPARRMRLLDDHVHDVPPAVYALLALLARHAPQPLDVIIERDGEYPAFASLLTQLDAARLALRSGRAAAVELREAA